MRGKRKHGGNPHKSQSAMEYLMTYGWAILVIAVVLGVLFQLGIFSAGNFAPKAKPGQCQVQVLGTGSSVTHQLAGLCSPELPQYVAKFDGQTSNVLMSKLSTPSGQSITVSLWIYLTSLPSTNGLGIFAVMGQNPTPGKLAAYFWNCGGAEVNLGVTNTGGTWNGQCSNSNYLLSTGKWYNIVVFADNPSSTLGLYLNGGSEYTGGFGVPGSLESSTSMAIGYYPGETSPYPGGDIANVQVYNVTLSSAEVLALYQEGVGGAPVRPQNLVGWWPLNGNFNDYSGLNNQGTGSSVGFDSSWASTYTGPQ